MKYAKGADLALSPNFDVSEFECPCRFCTTTEINPLLVKRLDDLRALLQTPIHITSGYRCASYQEDLRKRGYETAAKLSQHEIGNAADIRTGKHSGEELNQAARKVGFLAVGVGSTWVHVDVRDAPHFWCYKS